MRMLLLLALICAPCLYAQDDPIRLPAPKKGEAAIKDGEDAFAEGRMEDAVAHFTKAIAAQPENDEPYAYRAAAYVSLGKIDEASTDVEKAVELESTLSLTWNTRGYIAWMRRNHADAVENYTSAIAYAVNDRRVDDAGLAQIYQNRGVAYQDLGNTDRALLDFNKCIELVPENPAFLENRGLVYVEKELFDVAFLDFDKAVELDKKSARSYVNRAYAARQMGDYEQAVRDYSQALRLREDYAQALLGRGYSWLEWEQPRTARRDFEALLSNGVFKASGEVGIGDVEYSLGNYDQALMHYMKAAAADKRSAEAHFGVVRVLLHQEKHSLAQPWAKALCELQPGFATNWALAARVEYELGNNGEAMIFSNRAIEINPGLSTARSVRAEVYLALGLPKPALTDANQFVELNGKSPDSFILRAKAYYAFGNWDDCFSDLHEAKELGGDVAALATDKAFEKVWDDPRFQKAIGDE